MGETLYVWSPEFKMIFNNLRSYSLVDGQNRCISIGIGKTNRGYLYLPKSGPIYFGDDKDMYEMFLEYEKKEGPQSYAGTQYGWLKGE